MFDFGQLKESLLNASSAQVHKVEVNQRHLIDKILARYSAEFTVFRELIQNANDAGASEVLVEFLTDNRSDPSVHSICIRNNGRHFTDTDWLRLRRIAEGNPDEQKIGFFGVGFYSLFSICEEPFVISGAQCMGFYWNGDQLYTKSAPVPSKDDTQWTKIALKLRVPISLPEFDAFSQFLSKSLLFTASLTKTSFWVDDEMLFSAEKVASPSATDSIAIDHLKTRPNGLFDLQSIESRALQINIDKRYKSAEPSAKLDASTASAMFSGLWKLARSTLTEKGREEASLEAKLREPGKYHAFFQYFKTTANVRASSKFADEMERTTKKRPFKTVYIEAIYANWEQTHASTDSFSKHPILAQLIPSEKQGGKVFIGFETHQTTGLGFHLAAPFIPTVERESIDLVDGALKAWNGELLLLAGKLARHIYSRQAACIRADDPQYIAKAKHLMSCFSFKESTPLGVVSWAIFDDFLACKKQALLLPSLSRGFVPAANLRYVPREMCEFVQLCPRMPDSIASVCEDFLHKLSNFGTGNNESYQIKTISVDEFIQTELRARRLSEQETLACLRWWIGLVVSRQVGRKTCSDFLASFYVPSAHLDSTGAELPVFLGQCQFCACPELEDLFFAKDSTLKWFPIDCLSPRFSSKLSALELSSLGLSEMDVATWLESSVKSSAARDAIETETETAERLLVLLSASFSKPPRHEDPQIFRARICNSLAGIKCIPVAGGRMMKPAACYLEDIPQRQLLGAALDIVSFSSEPRRQRVNDDMLKASGVHAHLPLDQIFANIEDMQWDHSQLLNYLSKFRDELSSADMDRLRSVAIFPAENDDVRKRYRLRDLFAPCSVSEALKLKGLKWQGELPRLGSKIGDFLQSLGFNYVIPWRLVLGGVQGADDFGRQSLFRYFFENYSRYTDFHPGAIDFPCIPVEDDKTRLVLLPTQVFLDEELSILGFYLAATPLRGHASMLGIKARPSGTLLVDQLTKAARTSHPDASKTFAYLAQISSVFERRDWDRLRQASFIPVRGKEGDADVTHYRSPSQVFLKASDWLQSGRSLPALFEEVDFGVQANSFLRACGVQDEPQIEHLISLLVEDSSRVLALLQADKYLELLERLAAIWLEFKKSHAVLARSFASKRVFLGAIRNDRDTGSDSAASEETELSSLAASSRESLSESCNSAAGHLLSLYTVDEIFVVDDTISHQLFNLPTIPPQASEALQRLYRDLGSRLLSAAIRSEWRCVGAERGDGELVRSIRKLIKERLVLILTSLGTRAVTKNAKKRVLAAKLVQVERIRISRYCTVTKVEDVQWTCAACSNSSADSLVLFLAHNAQGTFDYFDLAAVMVGIVCESKGRVQDSLLVASLLTTPLTSLRAKGFIVEEVDKMTSQIRIEESSKDTPERSASSLSLTTDSVKKSASTTTEAKEAYKPPSAIEAPNSPPSETASRPPPSAASTKPSAPVAAPKPSASTSPLKKIGKSLASIWKSPGALLSPTLKPVATGSGTNDQRHLQSSLAQGIKSLRGNSGNDLRVHAEEPDVPKLPDESVPKQSYCQVPPVQSLRFHGLLEENVEFYVKADLPEDELMHLTYNDAFQQSLGSFHRLIVGELALSVFGVPSASAVHLFFDPTSSAIAFNTGRRLFFNFAHFNANEHGAVLVGSDLEAARRCRMFWFMTFCHELAHNFVGPHDERHEFYMSAFAETYINAFLKTMRN